MTKRNITHYVKLCVKILQRINVNVDNGITYVRKYKTKQNKNKKNMFNRNTRTKIDTILKGNILKWRFGGAKS